MTQLTSLSDQDLVAGFRDLSIEQKLILARELDYFAELDRRKLFFEFPSLRAYAVAEHGYEEWDAEKKIRAARLMLRFPFIRSGIESGALNLTLLELALGCAHREKLSDGELEALLEAISGMSTRRAMREIATLYPHSMELPRDKIRPISATHSQVTFAASEELLEKLEDIRGLLAHSHPGITLGGLIDVLATEYRRRHHPVEKANRALVKRRTRAVRPPSAQRVASPTPAAPAAPVRAAPPPLRRSDRAPTQEQIHALTLRDGYRCSFVNPQSRSRCTSTHGLEVDHVIPYADGGQTELENLRYLCRGHHQRVTFLRFGSP